MHRRPGLQKNPVGKTERGLRWRANGKKEGRRGLFRSDGKGERKS